MILKLIMISLLSSSTINCQSDRFEFISIDDASQSVQTKEMKFNLRDFLYLDTSYLSAISKIDSSYSSENYKDLERFKIDSIKADKLVLTSSYKSIEDMLIESDRNLSNYVVNRFDLRRNDFQISNIVLVSGSKAFVKYTESNASYALIFNLVEPEIVHISLAYIIAS